MFWFDSGLRKEGQNWLERALRLSPSNPLTVDRAVALNAVGECCWLLGEYEAADSYFQQALEISRELRDMRGMGQALVGLSVIAVQRGDRAEALRCCEEALPLSRAAGDLPFVALALHGFGIQAVIDNDESLAQVRIEESLRIWRELGDIEHESLACNNLGDLARKSGRYEEAAALYRECLRLIGEDGPQGWRATYLHNLAHALHRLGNVDEARHLFVQALGYARDLGDRRGVAECVAGLAGLVVEREPERTVRLFAAAEAIAEAMGSHLNPANRMEYDHILMLARRYVGEESFPVAWEQGRALALEEAIAEALAANGTSSQA